MNDEAFELEAIRQELDDLGSAIGSLCDYLDRGHPDEQEERDTLARMDELKQAEAETRARFTELLARLRSASPEIVKEWARWHIGFCERTIAETADARPQPNGYISDAQVANYVARETRSQWEEVLAGTKDFIWINSYFLWEYRRDVVAALEARRAQAGQNTA